VSLQNLTSSGSIFCDCCQKTTLEAAKLGGHAGTTMRFLRVESALLHEIVCSQRL
jgi:hypothetical protein